MTTEVEIQSFRGYTCWSHRAVQDVIPVDAVAPGDAVFLATHHPSRILRRPISSASGGTSVTEEQVLATFLDTRTDLLLLPVIGQAGTGKSHLIRWLHVKMPRSGNRRVIYVEKYGTTLRKVVELILDQMEGSEAEDLRASLREAADRLDEREAPTALRDALARTLRFRSLGDGSSRRTESEERQWVAENLPVLLQDPVFGRHFLREGGVIEGFVEKVLRGARAGDSQEAFAFTAGDFPSNLADIDRASAQAKGIHRDLSSDPQLKELAAAMLTEQLGPAVNDVFGLAGSTSLADVMHQTRMILAERNEELVILIEDFTVLQGIQRELLDALIEPPVRDGRRVLCPIRVAMAVTSGYFESLADTIKTRAGFVSDVYVLDVPYGTSEGWSPEAVVSFVGRYLNATRVGAARLQEDLAVAADFSNACDTCVHRPRCHEAFGASADGHGLYPYNRAALDRAVRAAIPAAGFDPRAVLGQVVRFSLDEQQQAIVDGRFPSRQFDENFREGSRNLRQLSIHVRQQLEHLPEPERRALLLTFWGDCPDEAVNLHPGIHEAFHLPLVVDISAAKPSTTHDTILPPGLTRGPEAILPAAVSNRLQQLERWAAGAGELQQELSRDLRTRLFDAVWGRVEWNDLFLHPGMDDQLRGIFDQYSFQIEGSTARRASTGGVLIELGRSVDTAALFHGIVQFNHFGHWGFPQGQRTHRRFRTLVDIWASRVVEAVERWRGGTGGDGGYVGPRLAALAMGARILGVSGAEKSDADSVIAAALADVVHSAPKADARGWGRIEDRAADERPRLRKELLDAVGGRQGTGATVYVVDTPRLRPYILPLLKDWQLDTAVIDGADVVAARYVGNLTKSLEDELPRERLALEAMMVKLDDYLAGTAGASELCSALDESAQAAAGLGVFVPAHELDEFRSDCQQAKRLRFSEVGEARDLLGRDWSAQRPAVLTRLARLDREMLERILTFCVKAAERLQQSIRRADVRLVSADHSADTMILDLESTLGQISELLATLGGP